MGRREPKVLRKGREFHHVVQGDWMRDTEVELSIEKLIRKPSGKRGRIDVFVCADRDLVAVIEAKTSDGDRMTVEALQRNVRRQARQVWDYIESQLAGGNDVSPGIVFLRRPRTTRRLQIIEGLFEECGIAVVWTDETLQQRRNRAGLPKQMTQFV